MPAWRNRGPILESNPIPFAMALMSPPPFSHNCAICSGRTAVDGCHYTLCLFSLHTDYDSIGICEILNGLTFSHKFWIRNQIVFNRLVLCGLYHLSNFL